MCIDTFTRSGFPHRNYLLLVVKGERHIIFFIRSELCPDVCQSQRSCTKSRKSQFVIKLIKHKTQKITNSWVSESPKFKTWHFRAAELTDTISRNSSCQYDHIYCDFHLFQYIFCAELAAVLVLRRCSSLRRNYIIIYFNYNKLQLSWHQKWNVYLMA